MPDAKLMAGTMVMEEEDWKEGERGQGIGTSPFIRCFLGPDFIRGLLNMLLYRLSAFQSLENSIQFLPPFLSKEEPPAQDGIQTQCTSG